MEWTDFLAEIADTHCLSSEQTEAFLIRLDDGNRGESEAKLSNKLNISAYAFKKRMSGVYEQFTQSCPELSASENRGKLQKLRAYLRREYTERLHKPLTHSDVSNVVAIQPFQEDINWREVCGKVFAKQQEKQLFRRSITGRGLGHEAKNVYVKLGLVKQKKQPQRGDDSQPSAERGMLQYRLTEKEIEQEYKYDEFLEQVIEKKEKNFAIVGEPGAGKSTWLEQIAQYVEQSEKDFPICISLASLAGKTLEEYLLQIWLEDALPFISPNAVEVTQELKNKLKELFKSGQAWLLLDGVDEMRLGGYEAPLQAISNQLRGWVDQARVVLTCRSNVWEANPNILPNFETYRTLHFDDQQVGDFIGKWFTQEGKPELGEKLQNKLGESGRERIQDLIKNPLRLAMLCKIWNFNQGDLPNTKAALYQQYIDYFYQWKPHSLRTEDLDKQEELHTALSKLALEAIDKRLPLRRKFVHKIIGQSLFKLARDVGWLNWVGKDSETGEDVYAFYHLTFQEYFAACAIDDWGYFLPRSHDNNNPKPVSERYRIFEPQWKEVILLWLGRDKTEVPDEHKEAFIQTLIQFEDGCGDFYQYRSYFLAAAGIAEFKDSNFADEIVEQVVRWSILGNIEELIGTDSPITEAARTTLQETDCSRAVEALLYLECQLGINDWWNERHSLQVAECLGTIAPNSSNAIANAVKVLLHLLYTSQNQYILESAIKNLGKFCTGNQSINQTLNNLLNASLDIWVIGETEVNDVPVYLLNSKVDLIDLVIKTADSLRESGFDISNAVRVLANLLDFTKDELTQYSLAGKLLELSPHNPTAIKVFRNLVESSQDDHIRLYASGYLDFSESEKINFLMELMNSSQNSDLNLEIATILLEVDRDNPKAINYLNSEADFLAAHQKEGIRQSVASSLISIDHERIKREAMKTLIELLSPNYQKDTRLFSVMSLYHIDPDNEDAINTVIELLLDTQEEDSRLLTADLLRFAGTKSQKIMPRVVTALKSSLQAKCCTDCYEALWRHTQNMAYPDFYQAWIK